MIHILLGTRAQLVKMGPVMRELEHRGIHYNFIFLPQHKDTMAEMIEMFEVKKPDVILLDPKKDITSVGSMAWWSVKIIFYGLTHKENIFKGDTNGIVLVHGDAPPALFGAILGKAAGLKVGHVESGLRSRSLWNPFPEELIRLMTFPLVTHYFCAGQWAVNNVKPYRGIKLNTKYNTLYDSVRLAVKVKRKVKVPVPNSKYCIVSTHRFENIVDRQRFNKIIAIIESIAQKTRVLFILHPPTRKKLLEYGLHSRLEKNPNVELRPRYGYFEFIKLLDGAEFLVTDGGSNQEESSYLGKPCLLLRTHTERVEGLDGNVVLSKFDDEVVTSFLRDYKKYARRIISDKTSPSKMIIDSLGEYYD